jgi:hypothetical protein
MVQTGLGCGLCYCLDTRGNDLRRGRQVLPWIVRAGFQGQVRKLPTKRAQPIEPAIRRTPLGGSIACGRRSLERSAIFQEPSTFHLIRRSITGISKLAFEWRTSKR